MSNPEIKLSWEDADELLSKYIRVVSDEGKFKPVPLSKREKLEEDEIEIIQMIIDDISLNGNEIEKYWLFKVLEDRIRINAEMRIHFYINNNDLKYANFLNLFTSIEFVDEMNSYPENYKNEIVNHYIKNISDVKVDGPSWDFIVMIDEPENYIHVSKHLLVKEIFMMILNFGNEYGFDTRILVNTHDDRIIKLIPEYIWNTNIAWKEDNIIFYKNIFNNSLENFIEELQNDVDKYFINSNVQDLKKEKSEIIFNRYKSIDKKFMEWFLCHKENFRIFFNRNIMVTEGYHDKIALKSIVEQIDVETQIIETDGTQEGLLIWSLIIKNNIKLFKKVSFLIDLDLKKTSEEGKYMYLENTYLMRLFLLHTFINSDNVNLYFSKYNDITQWVNFIEHKKEYLNQRKESNKIIEDDETIEESKIIKMFNSDKINFIKNYNEFNYSKFNYSPYELKNRIEEISKEYDYFTEDLFNEKLIIKDEKDFLSFIREHEIKRDFNEDWNQILIEDGKLYLHERIDGDKLQIQIEEELPKDFWKIDISKGESYIVDHESKTIIYMKITTFDDLYNDPNFVEDPVNPTLIEIKKFEYEEKYLNIFEPFFIKFKINNANAYIRIKNDRFDNGLFFESEKSIDADDIENKKEYYKRNILFDLFGVGCSLEREYIDKIDSIEWLKFACENKKQFYINFKQIKKGEKQRWIDYSIGPFEHQKAIQAFDEIIKERWIKF